MVAKRQFQSRNQQKTEPNGSVFCYLYHNRFGNHTVLR